MVSVRDRDCRSDNLKSKGSLSRWPAAAQRTSKRSAPCVRRRKSGASRTQSLLRECAIDGSTRWDGQDGMNDIAASGESTNEASDELCGIDALDGHTEKVAINFTYGRRLKPS